MKKFVFASLALFAFALVCDAGPLGIFGGRGSSGGCSSGSCGGGGGSSAMMHSSSSWGNSMPSRMVIPESGEVGSLNRTIDFFVNAERQRAGLPPVIVDPRMNVALQTATTNSAKQNATLTDFKSAPLPYKANFARGFQTPAGVVKAWMQVPELAANILSPNYGTCGYAQAVGSDGTKYWALAMSK